ncbi:hypothetical protein ACLD02_01970 [Alloalcanivorax sp. C16-2]|uniref:hypothetical protein n=1 Tax=Alloalcanivorax TaxID=3020832 RepID=UPI0019341223|nr:hypothetical protein [Alloalcanivorax marinus]MBL7250963.1 hypothetical protein [Alloalcanivorax marinus]
MLRSIALLGGLAALATGCAQQAVAPPADANLCPEPRPQACTMEYRPAIGYDKTGKQVGKFGNACHACGQDGVYYTLPEDGETR